MGFVFDDTGRAARICVAILIAALSFWLGVKRPKNDDLIPAYMMLIPLCLFIISPTGYPWYIIWFLPFLPFLPLYGAGLLTLTVALYYLRYAMSERDSYEIYSNVLVPLQFGLPILVLMFEGFKMRREARG